MRSKTQQDWIVTIKWVQATVSEGAWFWTFWQLDKVEGEDKPKLTVLEEGAAMSKLGVYWAAWKECRKRGFRFRPNMRGQIKEETG